MPVEDILASRDFSNLLSLFDHNNHTVIKAIDAIAKILDCGGDIPKSQKTPLQDDFRDAGGILLTTSLLMGEKAETDSLIKRQAMLLLRLSTRNHENCRAIVEQDGLFLIFQCLQVFSDPLVQEYAAGALFNICMVDSLTQNLIEVGGLDIMMMVLQQIISTSNQTFPKTVQMIMATLSFMMETDISYQHEICKLPGMIDFLVDCIRSSIIDDSSFSSLVNIIIAIFNMRSEKESELGIQSLKSQYPAIWTFPQKWYEAGGLEACKTILMKESSSISFKMNIVAILNSARLSLTREMLDNNMLDILIPIAIGDLEEEEENNNTSTASDANDNNETNTSNASSDSDRDILREHCVYVVCMLTESQLEDNKEILFLRSTKQIITTQSILHVLRDKRHHKSLRVIIDDLLMILSRLLNNNVYTCKAAMQENGLTILATMLHEYFIDNNNNHNDLNSEEKEPMIISILLSMAAISIQLDGPHVTKESNVIPTLVYFLAPGTTLSFQEIAIKAIISLATNSQNKLLLQESRFTEFIASNLQLLSLGCEGIGKHLFLIAFYKFIYNSSDLCRMDALDQTIEGYQRNNDSDNNDKSLSPTTTTQSTTRPSPLLLQELYGCLKLEDLLQDDDDDERKDCCLLALQILSSFTKITILKLRLVRHYQLLPHIVPFFDIQQRIYHNNDDEYEQTIRKLASSILLNYCGPHLDDNDYEEFQTLQIEQRLSHLLTFANNYNNNKDIINNVQGIKKWIAYMLEMMALRKNVKLLLGGQWIAPMECTLYRIGIPCELRRIIKRYLYRPLTNGSIRGIIFKWQGGSDPMISYQEYGHISEWDTSQVTKMDYIFSRMYNNSDDDDDDEDKNKRWFNEDIENWDVSNVISMIDMFQNCRGFNKPLNLWHVDNVENMVGMFCDAKKFNQPLDKWNVNKVTNFYCMFKGATAFNQPQLCWDPKTENKDANENENDHN